MATDLDLAYSRWIREESSESGLPPEETSIAQMLDHGSISFGRYAVESLSWEKWSVFTHDRNQEELEKFKAPGLVAKKKAYFEEYYKKLRILRAAADEHNQTDVIDYGSDGSIFSETVGKNQLGNQFRMTLSSAISTSYGGLVDISARQINDANSSSLIAGGDSAGTVSSFDSASGISDDIYLDRCSGNISQITHLDSDLTTPCPGSPKDSLNGVDLENIASDASQITQLDSEAFRPGHGIIEENLGVLHMKLNSFENDGSLLKSLKKTHSTERLKKGVGDKELTLRESRACDAHIHTLQCCGNSRASCAYPKMSRQNVSCFKSSTSHLIVTESEVSKKIHEHDSCSKMAGVSTETYRDSKTKMKSDPAKLFCRTSHLHKIPIKKGENIAHPTKVMNIGKLKNEKVPKGVRFSVTVPRPFSFATERRATTDKRPTASISRGQDEVHLNRKLKDKMRDVDSLHSKPIPSLRAISKKEFNSTCKRANLENRPADVIFGKSFLDKDRNLERMQRKTLTPGIGERDQILSKQKPRSMGNCASTKLCMNRTRNPADLNSAGITEKGEKEAPSSSSNQIVKTKTSRQEPRRWR